jgi:hypothetical protein
MAPSAQGVAPPRALAPSAAGVALGSFLAPLRGFELHIHGECGCSIVVVPLTSACVPAS